MKIDSSNAYLVAAGKLHPVIVEILTNEGITGVSEAAIAYGVVGTAAAWMVEDLGSASSDAIRRASRSCGRDVQPFLLGQGRRPHRFAGISVVEQTLWDINGKAFGVPLYELLGGCAIRRASTPTWYGAACTPAEIAKAVERPLRDGYKALTLFARRMGRRPAPPRDQSPGRLRLRESRLRPSQVAAAGGRARCRDHTRPVGRPRHRRDHPPVPALQGTRHHLD